MSVEKNLLNKPLEEDVVAGMLMLLKKKGSKTLEIPEGFTHIEDNVLNYRNSGLSYLKEIEEIIYPESMLCIGSSLGLCSLKRVTLPSNLKCIGGCAFNGNSYGFLGRDVKDKRTMEKIVIPAGAKLEADRSKGYFGCALTGIHAIEELIFEEGCTEIDWGMFFKNKVNYLYIPDSVKKLNNRKQFAADVEIEKISVPTHLKDRMSDKVAKEIIVR